MKGPHEANFGIEFPSPDRQIMDAVIKCTEQEYAPFFALPLRRRDGWRWMPFYSLGPVWPGPLGILFTFIGIWRFARKPRRIADLPDDTYCGCIVDETCSGLGSYGQGGPGFFGLKCRKGSESFWLVFTLWGAVEWLTLDGNLIERGPGGHDGKSRADRAMISAAALHGGSIQSVEFTDDRATIRIRGADSNHVLELRRDGSTVPPWRGSGKKKTFGAGEFLEDAIVISRRANLWTSA